MENVQSTEAYNCTNTFEYEYSRYWNVPKHKLSNKWTKYKWVLIISNNNVETITNAWNGFRTSKSITKLWLEWTTMIPQNQSQNAKCKLNKQMISQNQSQNTNVTMDGMLLYEWIVHNKVWQNCDQNTMQMNAMGQQSRTMNVTNNAVIMTEMRPNNLRSTGILCICTPMNYWQCCIR